MDDLGFETQPQPEKPTWTGADVGVIILGTVMIFLLAILALRVVAPLIPGLRQQLSSPSLRLSAGLGALEGIALILPIYFLGLRRKGYRWNALGLRRIDGNWLVIAALLGSAAIPLTGVVAGAVQLALGRQLENPQLPFLIPEGFSWIGALSMFFLAGIVAPFAEELFFRGVLYKWIRDRWGASAGILLSALVFGLLHGEISVASAAFVLGLLLAWIYEKSGSLWASISIHMINNGVKVILLYALLARGALPPAG